MAQTDADHDRYRALLKDAIDGPKRLALIQLLIDEGAKGKLAARLQMVEPETLPRLLPFVPSLLTHPEVPLEEAASSKVAIVDSSSKFAGLVTRLEAHKPEPQLLSFESPEPKSYSGPLGDEPQNVAEHVDGGEFQDSLPLLAAPLETATVDAIAPTRSELSSTDDLVDRIAKLLSSSAVQAKTTPIDTAAASSAVPPSGNDDQNSIASQIQAALANLDRQ
jgi:hypothetical protein